MAPPRRKAPSEARGRIPEKTVERLSQYRRALETGLKCSERERKTVFSHEIAEMCGLTAAQVRRDLMIVGHHGSTTRGYDCRDLVRAINELLGRSGVQRMVLVGVGHLGRALLSYFVDRSRMYAAVAAFDIDEAKTDKLVSGVLCYPMEKLAEVVRRERVSIGVVAVPEEAAQEVAGALVNAGIRGIVNFAPTRLQVPDGVFLETVDITGAVEKVAFFVCEERKDR